MDRPRTTCAVPRTVRIAGLTTAVLIALSWALMAPAASHDASAGMSAASGHGDTQRIIIDTDLSRWWDDVTALGMANVLEQHHQIQILAVMSDVKNPVAAAAIDAVDTAYGHGRIPVGAVAGSSANTAAHGYSDLLAHDLPHSVRSSAQAHPAVPLYRRVLATQPDHSVTIVAIGGDTNLAGLLRSGPGEGSSLDGRALVSRKVRDLVIEDGLFPTGGPAFTNELIDVAATKALVGTGGWPTRIAWVDGFTGINTKVGGSLCTSVPAKNPMRIVYADLFRCGPPGDGDWDGPTLLYAVEGGTGVFSVMGEGGAAVIDAQGGLTWGPGLGHPPETYVHVADQAALNARINALIESP
jgi:hypothetical protein